MIKEKHLSKHLVLLVLGLGFDHQQGMIKEEQFDV
jgi:hypothetical protein